jgi:hypothetical protein
LMAHPPSESANGRTNPASSRNLKPPALAGGVFTSHEIARKAKKSTNYNIIAAPVCCRPKLGGEMD